MLYSDVFILSIPIWVVNMMPVSSFLLLLAIASTNASPKHILYNNVTENMILRTFDDAPQGRIINGVEAKLFTRPYQASLQVYDQGEWFHFCGAVVIGRSLLACAAHCLVVFPPESVRVEVGSLNLKAAPLKYTQFIDVLRFSPNKDFTPDPNFLFANDIGLVHTKTHIVYNDNVQPVKIAPPDSNFVGEQCVISGWGRTYDGGPTSPVLLEAKMRIWSYAQCVAAHEPFGVAPNKNQICVKGESDIGLPPGACHGDSGGPLVCGKTHKYLLGVTSYVWDYCDVNYPTVYTSVPGYLDWINKNKQLEDFN